jgi:hypothetical protein
LDGTSDPGDPGGPGGPDPRSRSVAGPHTEELSAHAHG